MNFRSSMIAPNKSRSGSSQGNVALLGLAALNEVWHPVANLMDDVQESLEFLVQRGLAEHRFAIHAWIESESLRWETHLQRSGRVTIDDAVKLVARCRGWSNATPWGGRELDQRVQYVLHNEEYRLTALGMSFKFACIHGDEELPRFIDTMPPGEPKLGMSSLRALPERRHRSRE